MRISSSTSKRACHTTSSKQIFNAAKNIANTHCKYLKNVNLRINLTYSTDFPHLVLGGVLNSSFCTSNITSWMFFQKGLLSLGRGSVMQRWEKGKMILKFPRIQKQGQHFPKSFQQTHSGITSHSTVLTLGLMTPLFLK